MGFILISNASILILCCSSRSSLNCLHSWHKLVLSLRWEIGLLPSPDHQSSLSPSYSCCPSSRSGGTCSGCFAAGASGPRWSERTSWLPAVVSGTSTSSTPAGSEGPRLKWRFSMFTDWSGLPDWYVLGGHLLISYQDWGLHQNNWKIAAHFKAINQNKPLSLLLQWLKQTKLSRINTVINNILIDLLLLLLCSLLFIIFW